MKKFLVSLLVVCGCIGISFASSIGGFQDSLTVSSVAEALKMQDNSFAMIQGNIVKKVSGDKYLFKDSTGTITVEIDSDKWNGQVVNPDDEVELKGEVERKFNSIIFDVESVRKIEK